MDKGFTIKCNECGKETVFIQSTFIYNKRTEVKSIETNNRNIGLSVTGYEGQHAIQCECGNTVQSE